MIEDELLKWRFKRGSREALARIYEKYVNVLLSLAIGLLNDPAEAEDIVQDVFVSFARKAGSLDLQGSVRSYLAKSVVNGVRDKVRRERSQRRRTEKRNITAPAAGAADQSLIYSERCERLSRALAELPSEQREAVVLKTKNDMTLREIARLQGVSISTVNGRYRYGLDKLRALLNGDMDHER